MAMSPGKLHFYAGFLALFLSFRDCQCVNVDIGDVKFITDGNKIKDSPSSLYGYQIQLLENNAGKDISLMIGAPEKKLDSEHVGDKGGLDMCSLGSELDITCKPVKSLPGTGHGASFSFQPEQPATVCSPSQVLKCSSHASTPGFCYENSGGTKGDWRAPSAFSKSQECPRTEVDVLFVLDGSGSVGAAFGKVKKWVANITYGLDIERGYTKVGVIQYSHWSDDEATNFIKTEIAIGSSRNYKDFMNKLNRIILQNFTTYTGRALKKAANDFMEYGRESAKRVMVLVTDGDSTDNELVPTAAQDLRNMGVVNYAVGIGLVNGTELRLIANGNASSDERFYYLDNFDALKNISGTLEDSIQTYALEGTNAPNNSAIKLEYGQKGFSMWHGRSPLNIPKKMNSEG